MSESFRFEAPVRFTAGTVGEPGARTFFVQAAEGGQVVSLKLEKQQVAALAEYLEGLLADLPPEDEAAGDLPLDLIEPVLAEWTVGSIGVALDDDHGRFVVVIEELVPEDAREAPAVARFHLSRAQVAALVPHVGELIEGGRPPCAICGRPMDPAGHVCPRSNGHSRPS